MGKGEYELFVVNGGQLEKRKVQLGESNYEYVEVVSGLQEGDEVVISDMSSYKNKHKLKLKWEIIKADEYDKTGMETGIEPVAGKQIAEHDFHFGDGFGDLHDYGDCDSVSREHDAI